MQPLQSHTTDVDDNTSDNCGKLYYREILPTPYIYSQILFHWFISKSMCLLHTAPARGPRSSDAFPNAAGRASPEPGPRGVWQRFEKQQLELDMEKQTGSK